MYGDESAKAKVEQEHVRLRRQEAQAGNAVNQCASDGGLGRRFGIRERIEQTLAGAEIQFRRMNAAQRAKQIIDQHPELAELLDLLNEF